MNPTNRRSFIRNAITAGVFSFIPTSLLKSKNIAVGGFHVRYDEMDKHDIIPAPDDPALWKKWRDELNIWKQNARTRLQYDGSSYHAAPFQWVISDFACCFIMMCDATFYDHNSNTYTIDKLVEEGKRQYGGYDSVVLWHAYPRIGLDDRNQFDFYREMPGGLPGIMKTVEQFHQNNIKVFIDYNPWDTGTRREQGTDIESLINILVSIAADGIFLDTMRDAPDFRRKLDNVKPGVVMEGEISLPLEHIRTHHMSWAQGFRDSKAPGVYRNKWFEQCHMQHGIDRWNSDKTAQLHTAWMNGSGILIWENVFGQWMGWCERDKAIYRTMFTIQHYFAELFSGGDWTPLSRESLVSGVYISSWENEGIRLWTLVNRNESEAEGEFMRISAQENMYYFNLVTGKEIIKADDAKTVLFSGKICKRGIACFLALSVTRIRADFTGLLNRLAGLYGKASYDTTIPQNNNRLVRTQEIIRRATPPENMVAIPGCSLEMNKEFTIRETGAFGNVQEFLQMTRSQGLHELCRISRKTEIKRFAMEVTPVTNAQYKEFIDCSGYKPRYHDNFLKHWSQGKIPAGKEDHPVVYVDPDDARAYAKWAGKRLPSEDEWQFAAQGIQAFDYPWGNDIEVGKCNQSTMLETTPVKNFPGGISPFGCYDMCGNTWEFTESEYSDGRTRFVLLKGGSCYKANGSVWYMDGGPRKNSFFAKMLLIWSGIDRCATVGFRCAVDL